MNGKQTSFFTQAEASPNDEAGEWGTQTHYDYGFRIYEPGIGRFLSVDPLSKKYPELTPYQFASNTPVMAVDLDGLEAYRVIMDVSDQVIKVEYDKNLKVKNDILVIHESNAMTWYDDVNYSAFPEYFPNFSAGVFSKFRQREDDKDWLSIEAKFVEQEGIYGLDLTALGAKGGFIVENGAKDVSGFKYDTNNALFNYETIDRATEAGQSGFEASYIVGVEYKTPAGEFLSTNIRDASKQYNGAVFSIEANKNKESSFMWEVGVRFGWDTGYQGRVQLRANLKQRVEYTEQEQLLIKEEGYNENTH